MGRHLRARKINDDIELKLVEMTYGSDHHFIEVHIGNAVARIYPKNIKAVESVLQELRQLHGLGPAVEGPV